MPEGTTSVVPVDMYAKSICIYEVMCVCEEYICYEYIYMFEVRQ